MNEDEHDRYLDVAYEQLDNIFMLYRQFEDKHPIMLYDIQEQRIYAYPSNDFQKELSEKSQVMLRGQYEEALRRNKIVVFIRDNEERRLVSYSFQYSGQQERVWKKRKER